MNSSSELTWSPALDLRPEGVSRLDPTRIEDAVAEGYDDGYRRGFTEGRMAGYAMGHDTAAAEIEALRRDTAGVLAGLAALGQRLADSETATAARFASRVAEIAVDLSRAVLGRELSDETVAATDAVARALSGLDRGASVRIQVHPDDLALLATAGVPDNVVLEANPGLRRGDSVARTEDRTVDARIDAALSRALDVLEGRT